MILILLISLLVIVIVAMISNINNKKTETSVDNSQTVIDNNVNTSDENKNDNNNVNTPDENKNDNNNVNTPDENKNDNNNVNTPDENKNDNNNVNTPDENKNDNNNCDQIYMAIEDNKVFDITIPEKFVESEYSRVEYLGKVYSRNEYYYNKKSNILSSCEFSLQQVSSNLKLQDIVKNRKNCHNSSNQIKEVNINNIKWYNIEYDFIGTNYAYFTEKNGVVYEFNYKINDKEDYDFCKSSLDLVINSIKFK